MYLKKPGVIGINTTISAIINLLLNYFLIKGYGGIGAALATIVSYTILFILHYRAAIKYRKDVFCIKTMIISTFVLILYSVLFIFIKDNAIIRYVNVVIMISAFIYVYMKRKNEYI